MIREASKKMSQIQNAGLGEFKIRDLNDEINKALREKRHWENRILELGGRDMRRRSRMLDKEGKEVPGVHGYKYFGAARDLPGKICIGILSRDHIKSFRSTGVQFQPMKCRAVTTGGRGVRVGISPPEFRGSEKKMENLKPCWLGLRFVSFKGRGVQGILDTRFI